MVLWPWKSLGGRWDSYGGSCSFYMLYGLGRTASTAVYMPHASVIRRQNNLYETVTILYDLAALFIVLCRIFGSPRTILKGSIGPRQ